MLHCFPTGMAKLGPVADMETLAVKEIPVGRMGEKKDIALACVYLASSAGG